MSLFVSAVDTVFGAGLVVNSFLFIPQALRVIRTRETKDLSLVTFLGFCIEQFSAVLYGYLHADYTLMVGYMMSLSTCGTTTGLIIHNRLVKLRQKRESLADA